MGNRSLEGCIRLRSIPHPLRTHAAAPDYTNGPSRTLQRAWIDCGRSERCADPVKSCAPVATADRSPDADGCAHADHDDRPRGDRAGSRDRRRSPGLAPSRQAEGDGRPGAGGNAPAGDPDQRKGGRTRWPRRGDGPHGDGAAPPAPAHGFRDGPAGGRPDGGVRLAAGAEGTDDFGQGHTAARAFLEQYWHRAGFMARIPANTTLPLFLHDLAPQAVASGLVQFALIDGARLNVDVFARLEGEMDPPLLSFAPNFDKVHPRGTFQHPRLMQPLTYTVGDPPLAMTVGDDRDALHEAQTGAPLKGNYGVIYAFPIELTNPRPLPAILGLIFQASGGDGGGTVLLDDQIFDLAWVKSGERRLVTTVHLAPGEHRTVLVSTMPESGANYPVRLSLGSEYK